MISASSPSHFAVLSRANPPVPRFFAPSARQKGTGVIRLRVFGGVAATVDDSGADASVSVTRGYRLATLAVLAAAGTRGMTRDRLQALLWADSDATRAGASLSQTLYGIRQDLGTPDAVRSVGTTLLLNPAVIQSDVQAFTDAWSAGDWIRAIGQYGGPFLEGFYLKEALEFEQWVETTRALFADQYADALEKAATVAAGQGRAAQAAALWKQRVAHDRLDSRVARQYMEALANAGDIAGAVRHAQSHEQVVHQELGVPADPAVRRLAKELRERALISAPIRLPERDVVVPSEVAEPPVTPPPVASATAAGAVASPSGFRRAMGLVAVATLLVVTVTGIKALSKDAPANAPLPETPPQTDVAVLPFVVADSSLAFLRQGMIDLISHQLTGDVGLKALPPRLTIDSSLTARTDAEAIAVARQLDVPYAIHGSVVGSARHLVVNARLLPSSTGGDRVMATAEGPVDSIGAIVDRVVAQLLVGRSGEQANRVDDLTSRRLAPLRAYLKGQSAYRNGRLGDAVAQFRQALELDSTFSLAALGLARSGGFSPGGSTWRADEAVLRAAEQSARLSSRDRVLFEAFVGSARYEPTTAAIRLNEWQRAVELFPDDHEALFWYGDHLFHTGAYLGIANAQQRARDYFRDALQRDSLFALPLAHLLELAAAAGDTAAVRTLYARYARLDVTHAPEALGYITWRTAVSRGDQQALRAITSRMDTLPAQSLERIVTFSQLDGAVRLADADLAAAALAVRPDLLFRRTISLFVAHTFHLNRGRADDARRTLALLKVQEPIAPGIVEHLVNTNVLAITDALYGGGDVADAALAAAALRSTLKRAVPREGPARATYLAERCVSELWQLHRDDRSTVRETIRAFREIAARPDPSAQYHGNPALCAAILDAQASADEGHPSALARLITLDSLMASGPLSFGGHFGNIVVARLAERAGRPAMALQAVRRRRYFPADGAVYLTTLLRAEARLANTVGDTDGARRAQTTLSALLEPRR